MRISITSDKCGAYVCVCVVKAKMASVKWLFVDLFTRRIFNGIHRYVWEKIHVGAAPRGNSHNWSVHAWIFGLYEDWITKPLAKAAGKKVSCNISTPCQLAYPHTRVMCLCVCVCLCSPSHNL